MGALGGAEFTVIQYQCISCGLKGQAGARPGWLQARAFKWPFLGFLLFLSFPLPPSLFSSFPFFHSFPFWFHFLVLVPMYVHRGLCVCFLVHFPFDLSYFEADFPLKILACLTWVKTHREKKMAVLSVLDPREWSSRAGSSDVRASLRETISRGSN